MCQQESAKLATPRCPPTPVSGCIFSQWPWLQLRHVHLQEIAEAACAAPHRSYLEVLTQNRVRLQEGAEAVRTLLQPTCGELTDRLLSRRSGDAAALQSPLSAQPGLPLLPLPRPAFTGKL